MVLMVSLMSDSAAMVAYVSEHGGLVFLLFCLLARQFQDRWMDSVLLVAKFIPAGGTS